MWERWGERAISVSYSPDAHILMASRPPLKHLHSKVRWVKRLLSWQRLGGVVVRISDPAA